MPEEAKLTIQLVGEKRDLSSRTTYAPETDMFALPPPAPNITVSPESPEHPYMPSLDMLEQRMAELQQTIENIETGMLPEVKITPEGPEITIPDTDKLNENLDSLIEEMQQLQTVMQQMELTVTPEVLPVAQEIPAFDEFQQSLIDNLAELVQQRQEATDPVEQRVLDQMIAEQRSKAQRREEREVRRDIDPDFAKQESDSQRNEMLSLMAMASSKGGAGFLGGIGGSIANLLKQQQAASAAGASGMAGSAAMAAPMIGMGIELAERIKAAVKDTIAEVGKFGATIAAIDADGLMMNTNEFVKKMGFAGEIAGSFGDALFGIIGALDQTASRLAQYSPELAATEAMVEVRQIMNDIRRANQMGSELSDYLEKRQDVRERLERIMERLAQKLIPIVTEILRYVEAGISVTESGANAAVETAHIIAQMPGPLQGAFASLSYMLGQVENNTRPPDEELVPDWFGAMQAAAFLSNPTGVAGPVVPPAPPGIGGIVP